MTPDQALQYVREMKDPREMIAYITQLANVCDHHVECRHPSWGIWWVIRDKLRGLFTDLDHAFSPTEQP